MPVFENSNERLRGETSIEFTREVGRRVNLNLLVRPNGHGAPIHMRRNLHKVPSRPKLYTREYNTYLIRFHNRVNGANGTA